VGTIFSNPCDNEVTILFTSTQHSPSTINQQRSKSHDEKPVLSAGQRRTRHDHPANAVKNHHQSISHFKNQKEPQNMFGLFKKQPLHHPYYQDEFEDEGYYPYQVPYPNIRKPSGKSDTMFRNLFYLLGSVLLILIIAQLL